MTPFEQWSNATPEWKAQRRVELAAEREAQEARREAQAAEHAARRAYSMSDAGLAETVAAGGYGVSGGVHPRQAVPLQRLTTVAHRERAMREASTRQNLQGGVLSDQVHYAVNDLARMVAAGTEADEMYGERTARVYRERDNAERAQRVAVAAATVAAARATR